MDFKGETVILAYLLLAMKLCQYILCASSKNIFENEEKRLRLRVAVSKIHHVQGMHLY